MYELKLSFKYFSVNYVNLGNAYTGPQKGHIDESFESIFKLESLCYQKGFEAVCQSNLHPSPEKQHSIKKKNQLNKSTKKTQQQYNN